MRHLLFIILLFSSSFGISQRWHFQYGFKIGVGQNFLQGEEKLENGHQLNFQAGITGRISKKWLIMDMGLNFQYSPYFNSTFFNHQKTNTTGLNVPLTAGVILIDEALFKWNLQLGLQNSFVFTSGFEKQSSGQLIYNPYQLSGIISTGIESGWFTLDIYYQPAITKMFRGLGSGFNQSLNLSVGLIF